MQRPVTVTIMQYEPKVFVVTILIIWIKVLSGRSCLCSVLPLDTPGVLGSPLLTVHILFHSVSFLDLSVLFHGGVK